MLEAFSVAGRNGTPRVQITAGDVRVARRTGAVVRRSLRRATEAHRSAAGVGTDRRASSHRRRGEAREQRRLLGELVTASALDDPIPFYVDAVPLRDAHDARRTISVQQVVLRGSTEGAGIWAGACAARTCPSGNAHIGIHAGKSIRLDRLTAIGNGGPGVEATGTTAALRDSQVTGNGTAGRTPIDVVTPQRPRLRDTTCDHSASPAGRLWGVCSGD